MQITKEEVPKYPNSPKAEEARPKSVLSQQIQAQQVQHPLSTPVEKQAAVSNSNANPEKKDLLKAITSKFQTLFASNTASYSSMRSTTFTGSIFLVGES